MEIEGSETPSRQTRLGAHSLTWRLSADVWPVLGARLNLLLLAAPVSTFAWAVDANPSLVFTASLIALCPCAERLGYITEQLALHTNDAIGGLLNATFGNVTELVISVFAIKAGLLRIVQLSLLGSVMSNLLLVLGTAFIVGGIRHPVQTFNVVGSGVYSTLLMLAAIAILLPSTLQYTSTEAKPGQSELALSRAESIAMLGTYALLLVFQLSTHRHLLAEVPFVPVSIAAPPRARESAEDPWTSSAPADRLAGSAADSVRLIPGPSSLDLQRGAQSGALNGHKAPAASVFESEPEEPELSLVACVLWLTVAAVLIALLSEQLVGAIEAAAIGLHVPLPFLSTILLPIVGNAAEHASAITFAAKGRMELVMGVAVGSATQIGVLVMPVCVLVAWAFGEPLDLNISPFETVAFCGSVLLVIVTLQNASSNWLKGTALVTVYGFMCFGFWWHHDPLLQED